MLEKVVDGKDSLKIIVKASTLKGEGQVDNSKQDQSSIQQNTQSRSVRSVASTSPTMVSQTKMM
jgi:hypothetical protein